MLAQIPAASLCSTSLNNSLAFFFIKFLNFSQQTVILIEPPIHPIHDRLPLAFRLRLMLLEPEI